MPNPWDVVEEKPIGAWDVAKETPIGPTPMSAPTRGGAALSRGVSPSLQEKRKTAIQGLLKTATPMVDNPIVNTATYPLRAGIAQAASGVVRMSQPGVDSKLGGAADILEGGVMASTPFALPAMARAAIANPLKTAGGVLAGAATVPVVRLAAPAMGLGPGATQLASDLAGFYAGNKAYTALPGAKPKIPEYKEAPFVRIMNPPKARGGAVVNREGTGTYQKAVPEVVATDPMVKEAVSKWSEPQGSFTEYIAKEVGPKAQQRYWDTYEQMVAPYRDTVRTSGDDLANFLIESVPQDKIRGEHSAYVQGLISKYRGSNPTIGELETDLRSVNDYLKPFYAKSGSKQIAAARSDVADIGALEKLGGALREKIYTALDGTAGGELPAEAMRKYGAIKEFTDTVADLQMDALKGMTPSAAQRARQLAAGGAEAAAGFKHAAVSRFLRFFSGGEDTIDRALMKAFAGYDGRPTPMPLGSPEDIPMTGLQDRLLGPASVITPPPADTSGTVPFQMPLGETRWGYEGKVGPQRQLPAPMGPVGVSGTTVPDARGQILEMVNRETSGQRMLPPATPGGPARDVTAGVTQGNLGLGSQHSQVQPSTFSLPSRMPVPNNPPVDIAPQPNWPTGNQLSPDVISQFAQRNRISFVEAMKILQGGGRTPPPTLPSPERK